MIKLKNIFKKFGSKQVLSDVSLTVNTGETVCIIGPSGSGKSTLLRMINGLETPTTGSIFIDNAELTPKTAEALIKKTGMVFQLFNLFENMSIIDNVCYAPINVLNVPEQQARQNAKDLLTSVGLGQKINAFPRQLSGGQKQRAAIARALAMRPQIMLFDEVTSALDPEMVKEVLTVIKKLTHHGMTVILVTHEMGFAKEISDRIVFMDNGTILDEQKTVSFFENPRHPRIKDFLSKVL